MLKIFKSGNRRRAMTYVMLSMVLFPLITTTNLRLSDASEPGVSLDEATQYIRTAVHATDQAWEEFHAAAIEGTLASPLVQITIEGQLHEARDFLMQARKAKRSQDYQSVKEMTHRIQTISQNIIQASRVRKQ